MLKDEWDFWTSEQAEKMLDEHIKEVLLTFARKNLPPIQGQLDLVDDETEITPGIHVIAAPGHTPGHMAVEISSKANDCYAFLMLRCIPFIWNIPNGLLRPIFLPSKSRPPGSSF